MPRDRQRATLHHDPQYYRIRNHLVDFLVARSKELSHGRAPAQPAEVSPGWSTPSPSPHAPPQHTPEENRMSRLDVTEKIITTKVAKGIKWSDVATKVGLSKEWVTAACLGQMTLDAEAGRHASARSSA